jgi:zinc transporter, ZIP family
VAASFGWGTLAASSLVIGALVALRFRIGLRTIGLIMGFGAGVLISALSFDLVDEAVDKSSGHGWVVAGFFAGCLVFFGGDRMIDRLGGGERKDAKGDQEGGSSLAIVLGTVLDGVPESMVIGLTIYEGGAVGAAVAFVLAFAAGAILTMLAQTMMPEAYEHGGKYVGVVTTLGFAVAFTIHTLD